MYEAAHSEFLDEFIDRLRTGVPYQAIWFIHRRHRSVLDHQAVTEALLAHDADAAAATMLDHIERGMTATIAHLRTSSLTCCLAHRPGRAAPECGDRNRVCAGEHRAGL